MTSQRTLLVMAGGTGGHIMPALAVADHLRDRGWRIVWLGSRNGMESDLVPKRGYPIEYIRFAGLRGKGWLRAALLPLNLLVAFWQCARAIFSIHRTAERHSNVVVNRTEQGSVGYAGAEHRYVRGRDCNCGGTTREYVGGGYGGGYDRTAYSVRN